MKVNPYLQSNFYKARGRSSKSAVGSAVSASRQKLDTIDLGAGVRQSAFGSLVHSMAGDVVRTCESPTRMEELRQAVAGGSYYVPTEDLAGAILSHVTGE